MASPSQKKVDDFLSSLSQLSQDRIKEDQQRQRDLQRNIDELRKSRSSSPIKSVNEPSTSSYQMNIPELKFNRGGVNYSMNLNLMTPVARKDSGKGNPPVIKPKPKSKSNITYQPAKLSVQGSGIRSFGEMEQLIKQGQVEIGSTATAPTLESTTTTSSPPPLKPTPKGQWVNTSIQQQSKQLSDFDDDEKAPPPPIRTVKPYYLSSASSSNAPKVPTKSPILLQTSKQIPIKKDWLTSTLGNSKTTITSSTSDGAPQPSKPCKSDWLSSLSNSKTTRSTPQSSEVKESPPISKKPTSWIDSVVKSGSSKSLTQSVNQIDTVKISPKKSNWIDSAVRQSPSSKQTKIPEKPSYLNSIPTSDRIMEKVPENEEPEFLAKREKLLGHNSTVPNIPKKISPPVENIAEFKTAKLRSASPEKKPSSESAEISEYHSKLNRLRSQSPERKPIEKTFEEKEFMSKFQTVKSAVHPALKPKPASVYNAPPPEFQKRFETVNASKLKPPPKPNKNEYLKKDAETIQAQLKNLSKPGVPTKPKTLPLSSYVKKDTEVIQTQLSKLNKTGTNTDNSETFENKLNGLLSRAKTTPSGPIAPSQDLRRVKTDPVANEDNSRKEEKLTHLGKARSKGPKRRLPKNLSQSTPPPQEQQTIDYNIPKKLPPPINKHTKPKEVGQLKPTRDFSGELFI